MAAAIPSHDELMRMCIDKAVASARNSGGPFGALVTRNGVVIGLGTNAVTSLRDPTAHAEIQAIRAACQALGTFSLAGCELYASCEPCPMCLGAIYWARIATAYFSASRSDAARASFDDARIYDEISLPVEARTLPLRQLLPEEGNRPFEAWAKNPASVPY
jgi:guanine deaminase